MKIVGTIRSKRIPIAAGVAALGIALAILSGWYKLFRVEPDISRSAEEQFKYGSIGTEAANGLPYWIWLVLPRMFPEYLPGPGGYLSLGVAGEEGHEMPIGFTRKTIGFPRVGINCALCHTATFRTRVDEKPTIVLGGPAHQFDAQRYLRFLFDCANDPRFNSANVLAQIRPIHQLSFLDTELYRFLIIPQTRKALLQQRAANEWWNDRPKWGRGRIDPFNPVKFGTLKLPIDNTIGNSDMAPIWNLRAHAGDAYHWDGLNTVLRDVFLSSAIGDGATEQSVNLKGLAKIRRWLMNLPPPKYPFPIDQTSAARGRRSFNDRCASCHDPGQGRTGKVIPIDEIGTDRHRLDMWTKRAAATYNKFAKDYPWRFRGFRKTNGYVAVPLDGLWLRAPYLHNGSVPSLRDLLEPPPLRPKLFYRGYDVYDPEKVGFQSQGPDAVREGSRYDTSLPGNGNFGHAYGTDLPPQEKADLVEYLKTF